MILSLMPTMARSAEPLPVKVVTLSATVRRGDNASISVQTVAKAACTIAVRYKTGLSTAAGLTRKTADGAGRVGWTWRVSTTATKGKWPITVACSADGRQGTLETTFLVR
jgi:hypothetical protein